MKKNCNNLAKIRIDVNRRKASCQFYQWRLVSVYNISPRNG